MSFLKYLNKSIGEMAYNNDVTLVPSRKEEYVEQKNSEFMKLIKAGINSKHYSLWRYGVSTFYLTDENQNYLGFIDGEMLNNVFYIGLSHSDIKGNFYNLMFTSILGLTEIKEIISDNSLLPTAIKAYNGLANKSQLKLQIKTPNEYEEYSEENLLNNPMSRVSITEAFSISDVFNNAFAISSSKRLFLMKEDIFKTKTMVAVLLTKSQFKVMILINPKDKYIRVSTILSPEMKVTNALEQDINESDMSIEI